MPTSSDIMLYSSIDIDTAARTVWGEARGEPFAGKIAVAHVIKNRADNPGWWGHGLKGVCQKPWQFSCWNENDPNRAKLIGVSPSDESFQDCLLAVAGVLSGNYPDSTNGANHYHTKSIAPKWAEGQRPCAYVGNHVFYRL